MREFLRKVWEKLWPAVFLVIWTGLWVWGWLAWDDTGVVLDASDPADAYLAHEALRGRFGLIDEARNVYTTKGNFGGFLGFWGGFLIAALVTHACNRLLGCKD